MLNGLSEMKTWKLVILMILLAKERQIIAISGANKTRVKLGRIEVFDRNRLLFVIVLKLRWCRKL